jgi:hypothetical protein
MPLERVAEVFGIADFLQRRLGLDGGHPFAKIVESESEKTAHAEKDEQEDERDDRAGARPAIGGWFYAAMRGSFHESFPSGGAFFTLFCPPWR